VTKPQTWPCAAYDPGDDAPATDRQIAFTHCFFELSMRCTAKRQCEANMHSERRLLWRRLNELAAAGDDTAAEVLSQISGPDDLLGGPTS
jgi:hypothetical protein